MTKNREHRHKKTDSASLKVVFMSPQFSTFCPGRRRTKVLLRTHLSMQNKHFLFLLLPYKMIGGSNSDKYRGQKKVWVPIFFSFPLCVPEIQVGNHSQGLESETSLENCCIRHPVQRFTSPSLVSLCVFYPRCPPISQSTNICRGREGVCFLDSWFLLKTNRFCQPSSHALEISLEELAQRGPLLNRNLFAHARVNWD